MRIWFNRGFSLAPIAQAMLAADSSLEVLVSVGEGRPVYSGPTETFEEPDLEPSEYVDWVRDQIARRQIDVFVPTRLREHFYDADLPCRVHFPCSKSNYLVIEDKQAFSDATANEPFHLPTWPASSADELEERLALFRAWHDESLPCVKPRKGVNGHGFWKLPKDTAPSAHLLHPEFHTMRSDVFIAALRIQEREEPIAPLVLMDYLPGPEISFDVLAHEGQILKYVARTKFDRRQSIQSPHFLESEAAVLAARFMLYGLVNLQFRKAIDGSWKILEINARPAGGSIYAEDYGAGLIADWGGLLSGRLTANDIKPVKIDIEFETTSIRRLIEQKEAA
ncbi:ATP-grasp domain-containing protein [Croceicoccus mobilis]|uniref:ATP-grasp domain-containing protein n=1 Tax=Croceicoccus mobilis TaxID=1703339 RepID=A0A916YQ44_9SPHN|nr:ATP-grasp domain-containing protein [Croceicoccus mobilis]GGD56206.1 hypothetical protein GCM10010990_01750 [Croceicoccus mobilis]